MGRSVSTPSGARHVCHATCEADDTDDFVWLVNDFRQLVRRRFLSARDTDEWVGREDHAVAENSYAYFGVSEYCGLVAMWVKPKDDDHYDPSFAGRRDQWIEQIGPTFRRLASQCFGQALQHVGTASNGEAFFQPANGVQRGELGLGYTSKEGWL